MKSAKIIPGYKYFESQEPDEEVVFVVRRHWTVLVVPFLIGLIVIALTFAVIFLIGNFDSIHLSETGETILSCILSLIILYTSLYVFISWLIRYLNVVILTGEHLVEVSQLAIFSRKVSELDLDCIEDASSSQKGIVETMFHFGEVLIQTAGELPNFDFNGLEDPNGIQQKIMETKENYMKNNVYNNGQRPAQAPVNPQVAAAGGEANKGETPSETTKPGVPPAV